MRSMRAFPVMVCLFGLAGGSVYAVSLNPLENAYWRFEEGTAGAPVAQGDDTVPDSINANHMKTFNAASAPIYTSDVSVSVIPRTGASNHLALHFTPNQDIFAENGSKHIDNPIVDAFTVEAAFKPDVLGVFQAVVGKDGQPAAQPEQTWVLKIRGDDNSLQVEFWDKARAIHSIRSIAPMVAGQWYYAAVVNDGTTCTLYLDRRDGNGYVSQGQVTVSGALYQGGTDPNGFNTDWDIGRGQFNSNNTDWFHGTIDEVRISNTALSPADFLFSPPPILFNPDLNRDGHVDQTDLFIFDKCSTGPTILYNPGSLPPGCTLTPDSHGIIDADLDRDGDVDQDDFALFQAAYTG